MNDKGYWIERVEQIDMDGRRVLLLTANITPYGTLDESEIRKNAKAEMREIEHEFDGRCIKRTQMTPEFGVFKQITATAVKDKASLAQRPPIRVMFSSRLQTVIDWRLQRRFVI